jgi:hypothetical protein
MFKTPSAMTLSFLPVRQIGQGDNFGSFPLGSCLSLAKVLTRKFWKHQSINYVYFSLSAIQDQFPIFGQPGL